MSSHSNNRILSAMACRCNIEGEMTLVDRLLAAPRHDSKEFRMTATSPQPGWYFDPQSRGQRWWDGAAWGPFAPAPQPIAPLPPQEKSSGVAVLLTVLWPGAGHLYLGLTQKSIPYVVANAVGLFFAVWVYTLPISFVIWLVTLCMTVGSITHDTNFANDARRRGQRING
jgi:hypothetical protein